MQLTVSTQNRVPRGLGRQFVLVLRDCYRHQVEYLVKHRQAKDGTRVSDQDEWALECINMNRLQSIAEAFDDDSSGFVTIAEVNQFTSSRPKDWRYVTPSFWESSTRSLATKSPALADILGDRLESLHHAVP